MTVPSGASLLSAAGRAELAALYRGVLLDDIVPFWERHGFDHEYGGVFTALHRDGTLLDTDKSVWFQGRAAWVWATLYHKIEARPQWLATAQSCVCFLRQHCYSPAGKLYFTVTREGHPLRMRRYAFSEAFAAIAYAALHRIAPAELPAAAALEAFAGFLHYSFTPGATEPKYEPTRLMKGLAPLMIAIVSAQELRECMGDVSVSGKSCTEWIDHCIAEIQRDFWKPDAKALLENVALDGAIIDHLDGRTLNPGHAIECAWFILQEGRLRKDQRLINLGCDILDAMWTRGWDPIHGGLLYYTDLHGRPVQEYWQDMKFWWPHCEAILATLMAYQLTGEPRYAERFQQVHEWSFAHFPDPVHGEWYGYLHRDGSIAQPAKGNMFKGPFHLPRMLLIASQELRLEALKALS